MAAARTEPPDSASPPATYPSIIMTTVASRATGTAATTTSSASSVTPIVALAGLPGVRSVHAHTSGDLFQHHDGARCSPALDTGREPGPSPCLPETRQCGLVTRR